MPARRASGCCATSRRRLPRRNNQETACGLAKGTAKPQAANFGAPLMTLLYTDPIFLKHDTGRHPETADRLRSVTARLDKSGLDKKCTPGKYQPLAEETVAAVHSAK